MARQPRPPAFRIGLTPAAARDFRKLTPEVRRRVASKIDALAVNPRPRGVEKLEGEDDLCRLRTGDYRIIYSIHDQVLLVVAVKIGHRCDVDKALRLRR